MSCQDNQSELANENQINSSQKAPFGDDHEKANIVIAMQEICDEVPIGKNGHHPRDTALKKWQ